ncbi:hypothetical protein HK44_029045 (plasmid) [Pseudomonas fluorescens HK44]|uniref:Uncharacterized protein n=1 Tax=Pseudomonas fluorescens HK44 TaxID=1042209 RepID=A0A010SCD4_PSEFL|nr:F189 [uncultured bacterium]EXF90965.1 hypothetical protein HK44_029045 [Pseudomonas fluorescens HK44]
MKQEPGFSQVGIYILVGNAAEETIYIGEADPVGDRLKNHVSNKEGAAGCATVRAEWPATVPERRDAAPRCRAGPSP